MIFRFEWDSTHPHRDRYLRWLAQTIWCDRRISNERSSWHRAKCIGWSWWARSTRIPMKRWWKLKRKGNEMLEKGWVTDGLTQSWSENKRCMQSNMTLNGEWVDDWRVGVFGICEIAWESLISRLNHSPFTILRGQLFPLNDGFLHRKIHFIARVDPSADVHRTILPIERPTSVIWLAFSIVRAWRDAWDQSSGLDDAASSFTKFIVSWGHLTEKNRGESENFDSILSFQLFITCCTEPDRVAKTGRSTQ